MDENREVDAAEAARVSRRRALKAGAALGVGVTAWAGPQIGRMGATPAYAAACTVPFSTVTESDCKNTSCADKCDDGTSKYVEAQPKTVSGTVNGGTVTATVPVSSATPCYGPANRGQAQITVPNTTGQCRLRIRMYLGNPQCRAGGSEGLLATEFTGAVLAGQTGLVTLPDITCGPDFDSSNLFQNIQIQCTTSTDPNCF